jgi:ribokinase
VSVVVFGSVNADLVFPVPELPAPGRTVLGAAYSATPGGKGANQAVAAARDGARVAFAGAVGRDPLAAVALSALRASAGVDTSRVAETGAPTGCAAICVDPSGRNQIAVAAGANALARADQVEDAALGQGVVLLLQMEVPPAETAKLVARALARGARVVLNLAPAADLPGDALRAVDLLVVNEHEAAWLGGRLGCGATAADLRRALGGRPGVAVTRGAAGAEASAEGSVGAVAVGAFPAEAVDTTGAGDCWCGVLAAALDAGAPLEAAMRRAAAAAAIACTRPGAAAAMPDSAEIEALLAASA